MKSAVRSIDHGGSKMKWCFDHDVRWWDDSCPASRDECDEGCDVDVLIRAGDRVLYEQLRCNEGDHFMPDGLTCVEPHLYQVFPEVTK